MPGFNIRSKICISRNRRLSSLAVLAALAIILQTSPTLAQEFGAATNETDGPMIGEFDTEFEFSLGGQTFFEDDMDETYHVLPSLGAGATFAIGPDTRFRLGLRYARRSGDPYYDTPDFTGGENVTLTVVPFTMGITTNLARTSRVRVLFGFNMLFAHVRERIPVAFEDGQAMETDSGFLAGISLTFGPEWRSQDGDRAIGLEAEMTGCADDIGATRDHIVSLTGFGLKAYYTFTL